MANSRVCISYALVIREVVIAFCHASWPPLTNATQHPTNQPLRHRTPPNTLCCLWQNHRVLFILMHCYNKAMHHSCTLLRLFGCQDIPACFHLYFSGSSSLCLPLPIFGFPCLSLLSLPFSAFPAFLCFPCLSQPFPSFSCLHMPAFAFMPRSICLVLNFTLISAVKLLSKWPGSCF